MAVEGWIWDACGLLNLVATTRPEAILRALPAQSYVVDRVLAQEVRYLRPLPEEDPEGRLVVVDLSPLLEWGRLSSLPSQRPEGTRMPAPLLHEITLSSQEEATYLNYVQQIDDGEALTCAVAHHRGLAVVTDDCVAMKFAESLSPPIPLLTTPDWVRAWEQATSASSVEVADVVRRISLCGRWIPRRSHPDRAWWMHQLTSAC